MVQSPIRALLERVVAECAGLTDGEVADYIPELSKADPDWFGVAIASTDGQVYVSGDADQEFTIQSISKPFAYGAALDLLGPHAVGTRVGVEPTGNAFNAIVVDEATHRAFNPMVNAGAIVTASMLADTSPGQIAGMVDLLGRHAGRELTIDDDVWASERETGDRNRAIAYLMRSMGMLDNVEETLDLYFGQCSVRVTCADLAVMAATLANGGRNPLTNEEAIGEKNVERVLSVMSTCGMYDYAGEWAYAVGLPAKSGVSGGVLAVLPGQLGIGVFSPRLDAHGNSRRGIAVCERVSDAFGLHANRAWPRAQSAVRRRYRGSEVRSSRVRTAEQQQLLDTRGSEVAVFELHGDLLFASTERLCRVICDELEGMRLIVLDFRRVQAVDDPAIDLLELLVAELAGVGCGVALTNVDCTGDTDRLTGLPGVQVVDVVDTAIGEWEQATLAAHGMIRPGALDLGGHELLDGVGADAVAAIEVALEPRTYATGDVILRNGDPADCVCFVADGEVSVRLPLSSADRVARLATFGVGVAFGEAALLDERVRSADVVADYDAVVAILSTAALDEVDASFPGTKAAILANLAGVLARRLRAANAHIRALER